MPEHIHSFNTWPFPDDVQSVAYCTAKIARERFPVLQVSHDHDGDWQFLDATTDEPGECVLLCLGCVYERDSTLSEVADLPRGWSAFRPSLVATWERWENPPEADDGDELK